MLGSAQPTTESTSASRSMETPMAKRMSGESRVSGPLAMSSCSRVSESCTEDATLGKDAICDRNDGVKEAGSATCTTPARTHWASCAVEDATCTATPLALATTPHHFGFSFKVM